MIQIHVGTNQGKQFLLSRSIRPLCMFMCTFTFQFGKREQKQQQTIYPIIISTRITRTFGLLWSIQFCCAACATCSGLCSFLFQVTCQSFTFYSVEGYQTWAQGTTSAGSCTGTGLGSGVYCQLLKSLNTMQIPNSNAQTTTALKVSLLMKTKVKKIRLRRNRGWLGQACSAGCLIQEKWLPSPISGSQSEVFSDLASSPLTNSIIFLRLSSIEVRLISFSQAEAIRFTLSSSPSLYNRQLLLMFLPSCFNYSYHVQILRPFSASPLTTKYFSWKTDQWRGSSAWKLRTCSTQTRNLNSLTDIALLKLFIMNDSFRLYDIISNRKIQRSLHLPPITDAVLQSERFFKKFCDQTRIVDMNRVYAPKIRKEFVVEVQKRRFNRGLGLCTQMLDIEKNYMGKLFRKYK